MTPALLALLAFLTVQFAIGVWASRRITSEADYLLGGRRLGYTLASFSLFATWFGAETVVSSSGVVLTDGLSLGSAEPFGYGICLVLSGLILARRLWDRGLTTLADLFRQRFGAGVERLAAVLLIPTSIFWAAAQVRAFGQVIAIAGDVDVALAITGAALFTVAYTMFGGLLADAITDVLQGVVVTVGLVILGTVVVTRIGGVGETLAILAAHERIELTPASAGGWLPLLEEWSVPIIGSLAATELVGRFLAARSATVARRSAVIGGAIYLTVGSIPVLIALVGDGLVGPLGHPEQLLPTLARAILPPILFAVFAGGLVSAILSTVDSTLLVSSGIASHNLVVPMLGITEERTKVRIARLGVFTFGAIAYALALSADGIFALVEASSSFGTAGIVVTVLFALYSPWGSPRTAAATLVAGLASFLIATAAGSGIPFLVSLAVALLTWGIGCVLDSAQKRPQETS